MVQESCKCWDLVSYIRDLTVHLFIFWPVTKIHRVWCCYNVVNFSKILTIEGKVWGIFCECKPWLKFCLSHKMMSPFNWKEWSEKLPHFFFIEVSYDWRGAFYVQTHTTLHVRNSVAWQFCVIQGRAGIGNTMLQHVERHARIIFFHMVCEIDLLWYQTDIKGGIEK